MAYKTKKKKDGTLEDNTKERSALQEGREKRVQSGKFVRSCRKRKLKMGIVRGPWLKNNTG